MRRLVVFAATVTLGGAWALSLGCQHAAVGPPPVLVTTAEASGFVRTGRYDEAVRLCDDFARAYAGVTCERIGTTSEDRALVAVRISRLHRARRQAPAPVILIQAGIHAGEIEGKDAGFWFLRDLLDDKVAPGALDAVDVVFVPVLNPDGHERFSTNNRPNQRGPEEMGFRTTASNLNLNRDYMKADAPEIRALLHVIASTDPVMLVDLHTTDGAKFEHDVSVNVAPLAPRADGLDEVATTISDRAMPRLTALGHLPLPFYPAFIVDDDPASGFSLGEPPPRFSHAYASARSRLGVLIETHSWHPYHERVVATYHALQALFEQATTDVGAWREAEVAADAADVALHGPVPLVFEPDGHSHQIEFHGYAYEKRPSEISGGTWLWYDEQAPQIWDVPLLDRLAPKVEVTVPGAGYVVDGGFAPMVADVLDQHGFHYRWIEDRPAVAVEAYRATKVSYHPTFEGRTTVTLEGAWAPETRTLERHALFVPIHQPGVRVLLHLFEPVSPDSLAQWGFFNAVFERKEYMEPYVAEEVAREMLRDPAVKKAWEAALAADAALAASPDARLEWFYRRHPAWDERKDLLPVYRTDRELSPPPPSR